MATEILSTTLRDGEELHKINNWLLGFRGDELQAFYALRTGASTVKLFIEANRDQRLNIFSTSPPHGAFLTKGKTVPYLDVMFSEMIDSSSASSEISYNGTLLSNSRFSYPDEYSLRIDLSGLTIEDDGQHEFMFGAIKHRNRIWELTGENKIVWTTSTTGGTRSGEKIKDKDIRALSIARISVESNLSEKQILMEFFNNSKISPSDIVATQYLAGYPEFNKTTILIVYKVGPELPRIEFTTPRHGTCLYLDGNSAAPEPPLTIEIGFSKPLDTSQLSVAELEFDGEPVTTWDLSSDRKLLTLTTINPTEYKHHKLKLSGIKGVEFSRPNPYMSSFVVHKHIVSDTSTTLAELEELYIWDDAIAKNFGLHIIGEDPNNTGSPTIEAVGVAPIDLQIAPNAAGNVQLFKNSEVGENRSLILTGWSTVSSSTKLGRFTVNTDGDFTIVSQGDILLESSLGYIHSFNEDGTFRMPTAGATPTPQSGAFYFDGTSQYIGVTI